MIIAYIALRSISLSIFPSLPLSCENDKWLHYSDSGHRWRGPL